MYRTGNKTCLELLLILLGRNQAHFLTQKISSDSRLRGTWAHCGHNFGHSEIGVLVSALFCFELGMVPGGGEPQPLLQRRKLLISQSTKSLKSPQPTSSGTI
jgi:hypothetical protein